MRDFLLALSYGLAFGLGVVIGYVILGPPTGEGAVIYFSVVAYTWAFWRGRRSA